MHAGRKHTSVCSDDKVQVELEYAWVFKRKDKKFRGENFFFFFCVLRAWWGREGNTCSRSRSWVKISNLFLASFHPINRKDIRKKKIIAADLSQDSDGNVRFSSSTD